MPKLRRSDDQGFIVSSLIVAILSVLLGGGVAALAAKSVVNSYQSTDKVAVQTGPGSPIDPSKVITYGG
jgi:hypothetical protein